VGHPRQGQVHSDLSCEFERGVQVLLGLGGLVSADLMQHPVAGRAERVSARRNEKRSDSALGLAVGDDSGQLDRIYACRIGEEQSFVGRRQLSERDEHYGDLGRHA